MSACAGPAYYFQAIGGQLELLRARENVSELLSDPGTDPELASRLRTARDLLTFAEQRLDLPADDSYSTYVQTGRNAVVWNVIAAPEFSLAPRRWCFPVAGCVPYRGYFAKDKAFGFAEKLRRDGLDVSVRGASAYSTLGWFSDPLLDTMLAADDAQLAATLFHELAHQRLYIRGDAAFNEAYASFVGQQGVRDYLAATGEEDRLANWERVLNAQDDFSDLQGRTRLRLADVYSRNMDPEQMRAAKDQVLEDMRNQYRALVREQWDGRDFFGNWFHPGLNNADLALFADYHRGICAFRMLFRDANGDYVKFHRLAARQAGLPSPDRRQWLESACSPEMAGIASRFDM